LTTNRVKTIDDAFRSRTHVALHFKELTVEAKTQVWTAFLAKVGIKVGGEDGRMTAEQLIQLAGRNINGRQIKNAVRTASSLALGRNQQLEYSHFLECLDAMDDFTAEFNLLAAE
jgi:AAA+ superfamily predicted ATPase